LHLCVSTTCELLKGGCHHCTLFLQRSAMPKSSFSAGSDGCTVLEALAVVDALTASVEQRAPLW
jgi:hypothetical protein